VEHRDTRVLVHKVILVRRVIKVIKDHMVILEPKELLVHRAIRD
jgi:hypothetical protein